MAGTSKSALEMAVQFLETSISQLWLGCNTATNRMLHSFLYLQNKGVSINGGYPKMDDLGVPQFISIYGNPERIVKLTWIST